MQRLHLQSSQMSEESKESSFNSYWALEWFGTGNDTSSSSIEDWKEWLSSRFQLFPQSIPHCFWVVLDWWWSSLRKVELLEEGKWRLIFQHQRKAWFLSDVSKIFSFWWNNFFFFCPTKNSEHNSLCHKTRKNSRRRSILNCVWLLLGNFLPKNITKIGNV